MFRGPTRGSDPGASFSSFSIGELFEGDGTAYPSGGGFTVLGGASVPVLVGMGNTVMIYVRMNLLEPTLGSHIRFIDFYTFYVGTFMSAAGDPRMTHAETGDIFDDDLGYYMNTDVVPQVGLIEQAGTGGSTPSGVVAGSTVFGRNVLRHQWVTHRIPNPRLPENSSPLGNLTNSAIPVVKEIAVGDTLTVMARLRAMDNSEFPVFREGEQFQFAAVWGATARTP